MFPGWTFCRGTAGKIVYINAAPITGGNIKAGNSMIMEMGGVVVAPDYQDLLNSLAPPLAAPASSVDLSQSSPNGATTPVPTSSGTAADTTATPNTGTTPTTGNLETGTSTSTKSSAGSAVVGAALLAVPALLAVLL